MVSGITFGRRRSQPTTVAPGLHVVIAVGLSALLGAPQVASSAEGGISLGADAQALSVPTTPSAPSKSALHEHQRDTSETILIEEQGHVDEALSHESAPSK